jgi:hypothetical protein
LDLKLTVAAGPADRNNCPVRVPIAELKEGSTALLIEADSGNTITTQVGHGELAFLLNDLPRNTARHYKLSIGPSGGTGSSGSPAADPSFGVKQDGEALEFTVGGKLFTRYNFGPSNQRPFFHPVIGPGEKRVTRSFPMEPGYEAEESQDHPHHTGIYVAHGEVNDVNHWGVGAERCGKQLHREFSAIISGPIFSEIHEQLDWVDLQGKPMLFERRTLIVYNLPGEDRLVDVTTTLEARHGKIHFGDTKEAGLISVRVASSMEGKRGQGLIENAFGGKREPQTWGKPAPWCHYTGPVDGVSEGIGIFDHPSNPRFPTNWHVRDYGLFSANPFGYHDYFPGTQRDGSLTLNPGETATFRYRLHFHRGDAAAGHTANRWTDFALPPAAGVEE